MPVDVCSDDPDLFVMRIDRDADGYEPGDCHVRRGKDGDQERLVLAVPGYR
jgi:hypothetical protein